MTHGIINLSVVPVRLSDSDKAEMITQGVFGELIVVLAIKQSWARVQFLDDDYQGWIDQKQFLPLNEQEFAYYKTSKRYFTAEYITIAFGDEDFLMLPMGACLPFYQDATFNLNRKNYRIEAEIIAGVQSRETIIRIARLYLNTPYLWGGKSIFGIDCSGFTQQVYKICGINIPRDAHQQAHLGKPLSFIEEALPGDLAFFDNEEGEIIHVGIILENNQIIHAHGKVRINYLDSSGIFNAETKKHSHRLRVIKQML